MWTPDHRSDTCSDAAAADNGRVSGNPQEFQPEPAYLCQSNCRSAARGLMRGDHSRHVESASVGGFDATPANRSLVLCQRGGQVRSKDVQAFSWQSFSVALAESSTFSDKHRWRCTPHPIGKKEDVSPGNVR